jgi:WD40 repeat protein
MRKIILLLLLVFILIVASIYLIKPVGKKQEGQEHITNIKGGCLSPDKKYFSFSVTSEVDNLCYTETYIYSFEKSQIVRLEFTKKSLPSGSFAPIWSSDSKTITYLSYYPTNDIQQFCIYDMDMPQLSEQVVIANKSTSLRDFGPVLLSGPIYFANSRIVFFISYLSDEQNNYRGLYSINQNGEDMRRLSNIPEVFSIIPFPDSFVPKDKNIYCYGVHYKPNHQSGTQGIVAIYSINIESGEYKELSTFTNERARISEITYEPKNNHLLIACSEPNEAFIINPSEPDIQEDIIDLGDRRISSASWLNSEELICGDHLGCYRLNIVTKKLELLTHGEAINYVGFISDTKKVIGISQDNSSKKCSVWLMDLDGKKREIIFH